MTLRVLITGATGFIGRRLVEHVALQGHVVAAMANDAAPAPAGVEKLCVDVRDRAAVSAAVAAFAPRRIVHLAALSHVGESWRRIPETFAINVLGAEHVLEASPRGADLIFMSSAEVYGLVPDEEQPIVEERAAAPRTPYALSKAAAERLMLRAGATVIRSFNLIGSGQAPIFALPDFARQLAEIAALRRKPVLAVGNLTARRDFLHVDDAVEALTLLLESPAPGEVLNLASGRDLSIAEMLTRLIEISGIAVELEEDPARLRPVDVPRLCGETSRLRSRGWSARRSVDAALEDLWREAKSAAAGHRADGAAPGRSA